MRYSSLRNFGNVGLFTTKTVNPFANTSKRFFSLDNPREGATKTTAIPIGYSGLTLKGN